MTRRTYDVYRNGKLIHTNLESGVVKKKLKANINLVVYAEKGYLYDDKYIIKIHSITESESKRKCDFPKPLLDEWDAITSNARKNSGKNKNLGLRHRANPWKINI